MRIVGLVFALLVTLSVAAAALTYVQGHTWQDRIYVQGRWPSDTGRTAPAHPDPYLQRYYSASEGWTYYTLPSYSSGRRSGHE